MAIFGSKYANYGHGIRTGRWMVLQDGQRQEMTKHLQVKFQRGILTEEQENFCIDYFVHTGLPEDRDTEMLYSPRSRISGFNSESAQEREGWTDEEREFVEEALRKSYAYGDEFVELTAKPAEKPWPSYEVAPDAETVITIAKAIGVPLADVLAYERENAKRPEILEALEDELAGPKGDQEEELLITA